jgi:excisionase family DNA binding protein
MKIPNSVVRGLDGLVVASPKVACEVAGMVRREMDAALRRDGITFSDAARDWLAGLEFMAEKFAANHPLVAPLVALDEPPLSSSKVDDMKTVTKRQAAKVLHCSPQAVQDRISRGTLPATKDERGHYRISIADLPSCEAPDFARAVDHLNAAEDGYLAALAAISDVYEEQAGDLPPEATQFLEAIAGRCHFGLAQVALNTEILVLDRECKRSPEFAGAFLEFSTPGRAK